MYIGLFSLHLQTGVERWCLVQQSNIEFWRTIWNPPRETVPRPAFPCRPEATSSQPCRSWGKKLSTTRAHGICRLQYHDNPRNLTNFKRTKVCAVFSKRLDF